MNTNQKINKLRELMRGYGISFYIIPTSDPHGSEYIDEHYKDREFLTGFDGSAGTLIVSEDEASLFVDGRYHIQADRQTENTCIKVFKLGISGVPSVYDYLSEKAAPDDVVAFNGKTMMFSDFEALNRKVKARFEYEDDLVDQVYDNRRDASAEKVFLLSEDITGESVACKLKKIRDILLQKRSDGYFVSSLDDICYLFNFRGSDILYSSVAYSYAYITEHSATLFLKRNSYDESFLLELEKQGVFVADYEDIEQELFKIKGKRIIVDKDYTSAYFVKVLNLGNELSFEHNYDLIKKHIKNDKEQEMARKYALTDSVAVIEFIAKIKEKIAEGAALSEYDASELLASHRVSKEGFFDLSFETISAYGENAAIVHYAPDKNNSKKLENRGLLLVDSGAHYIGATTDITRTIVLGNITDDEKRAYTLVLKGNLNLMDAVFIKGTRCENLDILAREALWKNGLDYRHGTGHGIGAFLNVHEGPFRIGYKIREDMPQPDIEPGMIISDEPGYYETGKFGIRHETQLLCVKKRETEYGEFYGFEPLSLVPFEKEAIDFDLLTAEEENILKRYSEMIREKVSPYLSERAKRWMFETTNYVD